MRGPGFNPRHLQVFLFFFPFPSYYPFQPLTKILFLPSVGTACEHLGFSIALDVPIFVVVTKADLCTPQQVQKILEQLERLLSSAGCKKVPYRVNTVSDAYNAAQKFSNKKLVIDSLDITVQLPQPVSYNETYL